MRRRLVVTTVLIALAAVLVLGVPLGVVESRRVRADELGRLEREADEVAGAIDERAEAGPRLPAAALRPFLRPRQAVVVRVGGRRIEVGDRPAGATLTGHSGAGRGAQVTVIAPAGDLAARRREVWLLIGLLAVAGTAAAAGLAVLQAKRIALPLARLTRTSERLGSGDFSARNGPLELPEFERVGRVLDRAASQIAQLVGRQREFAANVSHQLRSPLTALRLRLEEARALEDSDAVRNEVGAALSMADRLERTVDDLLAFARAGDLGEPRDVDLRALVRQHVSDWQPVFRRHARALAQRLDGPLPARVRAGGVAQALDVLIENALWHGGGAVIVEGSSRDGRSVLAVVDEGAGVPAGMTGDIFERSVSTAASTGVGLPLARALVEADGGRLVLAARAPARFEIHVPRRPVNAPTP